jgi:hypothetical protein
LFWDAQSVYAQHILQNVREYGTITDKMSLLKPVHNTAMLIPYEQFFIQTSHHNSKLIPEQCSGESDVKTLSKETDTSHTSHSNQF